MPLIAGFGMLIHTKSRRTMIKNGLGCVYEEVFKGIECCMEG